MKLNQRAKFSENNNVQKFLLLSVFIMTLFTLDDFKRLSVIVRFAQLLMSTKLK